MSVNVNVTRLPSAVPVSATMLPAASSRKRPLQTGAQAATLTQLRVKCPFFCKQEVAVEAVKLAKSNEWTAVWSCNKCRQIKKKQVRVTWSHFVCVQCSDASGKESSLECCPNGCPTKQALKNKKDAVVAPKAKPKPVMPIVVADTSKAKPTPHFRAGKQSEVEVGNTTKNPFPSGYIGLCPHCHTAADVSSFSIDLRHRIWCAQSECKTQSIMTHWFCVKCSSEANTRGKAGKASKVKFWKLCMLCDVALGARQNLIELSPGNVSWVERLR